MTAAEILRMIEAVDPEDTGKLDEIDARVWCYLNDARFKRMLSNKYPTLTPNKFSFYQRGSLSTRLIVYAYKYTRSRDALKEIRPPEWEYFCGYKYPLGDHPVKFAKLVQETSLDACQVCATGKTEELAELSVIIKAIEHERGGK